MKTIKTLSILLLSISILFSIEFSQAAEQNKQYFYQYQLSATPVAKVIKSTVKKSKKHNKRSKSKKSKRTKLKILARKMARKHKIPTKLFLALVTQESQWRPHVVSHRGATGLTQLMPKTAKAACNLNRWELKDPKKNLDCGAKYLAQQIKRFGQISKGVCAFNAGPTIVAKLGRCPRYKETQNYVRKLMRAVN